MTEHRFYGCLSFPISLCPVIVGTRRQDKERLMKKKKYIVLLIADFSSQGQYHNQVTAANG